MAVKKSKCGQRRLTTTSHGWQGFEVAGQKVKLFLNL